MRKVVMRSVFLGAATSAAVLISFPSFPDTSGFISKPQQSIVRLKAIGSQSRRDQALRLFKPVSVCR
jgi:hypothetical protein